MSAKQKMCALGWMTAWATTISPALAFDPLLTHGSIPSAASAELLPGVTPCSFGAPGNPLKLDEAVERALCHNPKTRQAWADVKAQAAAVGAARAAYLPTLSANWQGVRDNSVTDVNGHPELSSHSNSTVRSEDIQLNWLLLDFGGRSAALRNASDLLAAARATQNATLQDEFASVTKDYFAAQASMGALQAAHDIEVLTGDSMKAAQQRVDRGVAPITDALQAQTQHDEAVFNETKAQGDLQIALGTLSSEMGLTPDMAIEVPSVTSTALPDKAWHESIEQLIDDVKHTHPAVVAAQQTYEAALEKVSQTRAEGLPSISLTGKYSRNNQPATLGLGIPTFPATGHDAFIGVQVSIPLFEGFQRHYQIEQAKAEAEHQEDALDETIRQVALDVWTAYQSLETATQNASHSETLLAISQQAFDAAQHRYLSGVGNILELLNTQTALSNARQRRVQALADWHTAKLQLASKLGRLDMSSIASSGAF
ncbi:TolC family protein [Burkholderia glumae]|uniref:TolC family protein n=1 Tax=Burkholderia glumae TaxID=337 RepID=UPI0001A4AFA2|nr:TolC family protein [Burkholderia glumae]ACR32598.1 Fis family transcriptional regulator [Burkholderia glumae BGR1]UVS88708.1 TolC family protein [Burkholderia glumae]UVT05730.1 TolC family protein [Burkholderia glumae]